MTLYWKKIEILFFLYGNLSHGVTKIAEMSRECDWRTVLYGMEHASYRRTLCYHAFYKIAIYRYRSIIVRYHTLRLRRQVLTTITIMIVIPAVFRVRRPSSTTRRFMDSDVHDVIYVRRVRKTSARSLVRPKNTRTDIEYVAWRYYRRARRSHVRIYGGVAPGSKLCFRITTR